MSEVKVYPAILSFKEWLECIRNISLIKYLEFDEVTREKLQKQHQQYIKRAKKMSPFMDDNKWLMKKYGLTWNNLYPRGGAQSEAVCPSCHTTNVHYDCAKRVFHCLNPNCKYVWEDKMSVKEYHKLMEEYNVIREKLRKEYAEYCATHLRKWREHIKKERERPESR